MNLNQIDNSETLFRVVRKSDPNGFIDGKPTAALFIDPRGTSVDRDGGRKESEIIDSFRKRFDKRDDYGKAVKIGAGTCRAIGTYPNPIGNTRNKYHAEIWESEKEPVISLLKAIRLAAECKMVEE